MSDLASSKNDHKEPKIPSASSKSSSSLKDLSRYQIPRKNSGSSKITGDSGFNKDDDSSEAETVIMENAPSTTRKLKRLKRRRSSSDDDFWSDDIKPSKPERKESTPGDNGETTKTKSSVSKSLKKSSDLPSHSRNVSKSSQSAMSRSPASRSNSPGVAMPLCSRKQSRSGRDANGRLKLQRMCDKGKYEEAKELILHGADVNDRDYAGNTAIHEAALKGHTRIVELLIDNGAIIDIRSGPGDLDTPLIDAAANDHLEVVSLLLKRGADPRIFNAQGKTSMDSIQEDKPNHVKIEKLLREASLVFRRKREVDRQTPTGDASDDPDNHQDFMDPANYPSGTFPPPASNDSTNIQSVSSSAPRRRGARAQAIRNDLLWMDLTTRTGREQIYRKAADGDIEFVGNFLENGWKPDADCLALAARHGHTDVVGLLLAFGAETDGLNEDGETALQQTVGRGHFVTVKLLLDSGANPNVINHAGKTCLQLSQESLSSDDKEVALIASAMKEYKKSNSKLPDNDLSDRSTRHQRGEKHERHERNDKPDRISKQERNDKDRHDKRIDKHERSEKIERQERHERSDKRERSERPEKVDKYQRTEKQERTEKYDRAEKHERSEKHKRPDKHERVERVERVEKLEKHRKSVIDEDELLERKPKKMKYLEGTDTKSDSKSRKEIEPKVLKKHRSETRTEAGDDKPRGKLVSAIFKDKSRDSDEKRIKVSSKESRLDQERHKIKPRLENESKSRDSHESRPRVDSEPKSKMEVEPKPRVDTEPKQRLNNESKSSVDSESKMKLEGEIKPRDPQKTIKPRDDHDSSSVSTKKKQIIPEESVNKSQDTELKSKSEEPKPSKEESPQKLEDNQAPISKETSHDSTPDLPPKISQEPETKIKRENSLEGLNLQAEDPDRKKEKDKAALKLRELLTVKREKERKEREKKMLLQLEVEEKRKLEKRQRDEELEKQRKEKEREESIKQKARDLAAEQERQRQLQVRAEVEARKNYPYGLRMANYSTRTIDQTIEYLPLLARRFRSGAAAITTSDKMGCYVIDMQVALLLGVQNIYQAYPDLSKKLVTDQEKLRLWTLFIPYLCPSVPKFGDTPNEDIIQDRNDNKKRFMALSVFWLRVDQVEEIMSRDYYQVFQLYNSVGLLNIDLDYEAPSEAQPDDLSPVSPEIPTEINMPLKLKVKLMSQLVPNLW